MEVNSFRFDQYYEGGCRGHKGLAQRGGFGGHNCSLLERTASISTKASSLVGVKEPRQVEQRGG